MIEIGDRIRDAGKDRYTGELSINRDIHSAIDYEARRHIVDCRSEERHCGGIRPIGPARALDLSSDAKLAAYGMRIGQCRKVVAVKAAPARTADPLHGFVEVEVMLAEVFAEKHSGRVTDRADSDAGRSRRKGGGIERRQGGPRTFLPEYPVFET